MYRLRKNGSINFKNMKNIIFLLLTNIGLLAQDLQFKGCVGNMLQFEYKTGNLEPYNYTVTRVDRDGNDLDCERAYLMLVSAKESFTFEIPASACNAYTSIKVECICAAASAFETVEKSSYCNAPLPIKLKSFAGVRNNGLVNLSWKTGDRSIFSHFEIEAGNGSEFHSAGATAQNYFSFESKNEYFRLKMVDLDGQFAYSKIIFISKYLEDEKIFITQLAIGDMYIVSGRKVMVIR